MADTKISALTELTALADADELVIVDKSDTTMAASGTTKRVTASLFDAAVIYRVLARDSTHISSAAAVGTKYFLLANGTNASSLSMTAAAGSLPWSIDLDAADYAVTGKTTMLRIRATVTPGAFSPEADYIVGLYPVTNASNPVLGTVLAGSEVTVASPAGATARRAVGADFAFPSAGIYALGVRVSVVPTQGARVAAILQEHGVS